MVAVSVEENAPSEMTEMATIMQLSHYLATPSSEFVYKFLWIVCRIFKYIQENPAEIFYLKQFLRGKAIFEFYCLAYFLSYCLRCN
jgi:hypothetical protein